MPSFKERKSFGPSGLADLRVSAKGVRVVFNDGNLYDLPAGATDRPSGKYVIGLSQDLTKILRVSPVAGTYIVHFKQFGNRINGIPDKKIQRGGPRQSKDGKKKWVAPDQLVFVAEMEIESEGNYKGLIIRTNLPYSFVASPTGGNCDVYDDARNLKRLEEFMRIAGFDPMRDIPFSQNVLPWWEGELQAIGRPFMAVTTAEGFIDSISEIPADLLPKKSSKKASK